MVECLADKLMIVVEVSFLSLAHFPLQNCFFTMGSFFAVTVPLLVVTKSAVTDIAAHCNTGIIPVVSVLLIGHGVPPSSTPTQTEMKLYQWYAGSDH